MGKLTTHLLDLHSGKPAPGVRIDLHVLETAGPRLLMSLHSNEDGRCPAPLLADDALQTGRYQLSFHVADYYRAGGMVLPDPPFIDIAVLHFGIADATQHYHVPLLMTPWSYSTYRGS